MIYILFRSSIISFIVLSIWKKAALKNLMLRKNWHASPTEHTRRYLITNISPYVKSIKYGCGEANYSSIQTLCWTYLIYMVVHYTAIRLANEAFLTSLNYYCKWEWRMASSKNVYFPISWSMKIFTDALLSPNHNHATVQILLNLLYFSTADLKLRFYSLPSQNYI